MSNFSLASLNSFFYPDYNPSNPPIPNANGDLAFCMEYDDATNVKGHLRLEYHYTIASQPGTLKVVRFTTKIFKDSNGNILTDDAAINARFYWGKDQNDTITLIWMDSVGFMSVTADLVAGSAYNGKVNFVNMPGDSDVDDGNGNLTLADVANTSDEEKCLSGTWNANTCVSTKVFGRAFYEKGRDGSTTNARANRVVNMVKKLITNSHPTEFSDFEIDSQLLGDSMDIDLDDAKATTLTQ